MADYPWSRSRDVQNEGGSGAQALDFSRVVNENREGVRAQYFGGRRQDQRMMDNIGAQFNYPAATRRLGDRTPQPAPGSIMPDYATRYPAPEQPVGYMPINDQTIGERQRKPPTIADMFDGMKKKAEARQEARAEAKEEKKTQEKLEKAEKLLPAGPVGDLMKQAARQAIAGNIDAQDLQRRLATATIPDDQVDKQFGQIKQFQDALNKELGVYMYYGSNELFISENNPKQFSSACMHIPAEGAISTFDRMKEGNTNEAPVDRAISMQEASARIKSKARWMARK